MNKLLYFSDDDVQSQLATKYNLLVNIGLETFQYAIIDNARDRIKVLAEFEIPEVSNIAGLIRAIEELPESARQFKFSFNSVRISVDTSNYTFIPADLYAEENRQDYGKYLNQTGTGEILVNNIPSFEIKNVVAIEGQLHEALHRIFQKPKIYNQATPFLEGTQKTLKREDDLACFIDIHPKHFQVALLRDFKLEFYNFFEYANADEFNYYLLNIIESHALKIEETPIFLSGKISESDEIYRRTEKYFDNIHFIDTDHFRKYSDQFEDVIPHTFFTLMSLDLCE